MRKIKIALTNEAAVERALEVAKATVPGTDPETLTTWERMAKTSKVMKIDGTEVKDVRFSS